MGMQLQEVWCGTEEVERRLRGSLNLKILPVDTRTANVLSAVSQILLYAWGEYGPDENISLPRYGLNRR